MARLNASSICIIIENETVPCDRRVWIEARALHAVGYEVSVICPKKHGYYSSFEISEGIHVYRYPVWIAKSHWQHTFEYFFALLAKLFLAFKVYLRRPVQVLQGCNPPDTIFLVALPFKLLGVRFIFDHHDLSPELYELKFAKRGLLYRLQLLLERATFRTADLSIATNESYRKIAISRGGVSPDNVVVVQTRSPHRCLRLRSHP